MNDPQANPTPTPPMHTFTSGAKSTVVKPRYDLIPLRGLELVAERFEYGAGRHGERNYRKGGDDPVFVQDRINHLIEHCMKFAEHRRREDLAAVICNAMILADVHADRPQDVNITSTPEPPRIVSIVGPLQVGSGGGVCVGQTSPWVLR